MCRPSVTGHKTLPRHGTFLCHSSRGLPLYIFLVCIAVVFFFMESGAGSALVLFRTHNDCNTFLSIGIVLAYWMMSFFVRPNEFSPLLAYASVPYFISSRSSSRCCSRIFYYPHYPVIIQLLYSLWVRVLLSYLSLVFRHSPLAELRSQDLVRTPAVPSTRRRHHRG